MINSAATTTTLLFLAIPTGAAPDIAKFGACFHERTQTPRCAFDKSSCHRPNDGDSIWQSGEVWMTPFQLDQSGMSCDCTKTDIASCTLPGDGHGSNDPTRCVASRDACEALGGTMGTVGYHRNDGGTCMCHAYTDHEFLEGDNVDETPTAYGACRGDEGDRCSFGPSDCDGGETWVSHLEAMCSCEEVRVGACYHLLGTICAVNGDVCTAPSKWITPLESEGKGVDCRLCSFEGTPLDINISKDDGGESAPSEKGISASSSSDDSSGQSKYEVPGPDDDFDDSKMESSAKVSASSADSTSSEDESGIMIILYTVSAVAVTSSVALFVVLLLSYQKIKRMKAAVLDAEGNAPHGIEIDMPSVA